MAALPSAASSSREETPEGVLFIAPFARRAKFFRRPRPDGAETDGIALKNSAPLLLNRASHALNRHGDRLSAANAEARETFLGAAGLKGGQERR